MVSDRFIEKLKVALEKKAQRPTRERWNDLIKRGAIDAEGNVLIRGPEAMPSTAPRPKGRRKSRSV